MTGQRTLHLTAVGVVDDDSTKIARQRDNRQLDLNVEFLIRDEHSKRLDLDENENNVS